MEYKMLKHDFYTDGGHGWLKVPLNRLKKLGIAEEITSHSHMLTKCAYLEEDCDVSIYIRALQKEAGLDPNAMESDESRRWLEAFWDNCTTHDTSMSKVGSRVRSYPRYEFISDEEQLELETLRSKILTLKNWNRSAINTIKKAGKSDLLHWKEHYKLGALSPAT